MPLQSVTRSNSTCCQTYRSLGLPLSVHVYNDNMDRAMTALEDARELIGQAVATNVVAKLM
jgi:hypothetical protein